ncbi:MAG: ArnT family glycosyltransferase [Bdellovibrionota bacterium]
MRKSIVPLVALALLVVLWRSLIYLIYEQATFDSDQAYFALMARDLAYGLGLPIYQPGVRYVLGVEAWLAAPLVHWFGANITTVRAPTFLMNLASGALLTFHALKSSKMEKWAVFGACLFFLLPAPHVGSYFMNLGATGPWLLAVLLLWTFRENPVALGLTLGLGYQVRPFVGYGFIALVTLDYLTGKLSTRLKQRILSLSLCIVIGITIHWLAAHYSTNYGGAAPGPILKTPWHLFEDFRWLVAENLPSIFGIRELSLLQYNTPSTVALGSNWLILPAWIITVLFARRAWQLFRGKPLTNFRSGKYPDAEFPIYLMIVSFLTAFVYAAFSPLVGNPMLLRYTMACAFAPVGFLLWYLPLEKNTRYRRAAWALTLLWVGYMFQAQTRLNMEYFLGHPQNRFRELADRLEQEKITRAKADYWIAAHITFFTDERVILAPWPYGKIPRYEQEVRSALHGTELPLVTFETCPSGASDEKVSDFHICKDSREAYPAKSNGPK